VAQKKGGREATQVYRLDAAPSGGGCSEALRQQCFADRYLLTKSPYEPLMVRSVSKKETRARLYVRALANSRYQKAGLISPATFSQV
jgi:hypothetical protein